MTNVVIEDIYVGLCLWSLVLFIWTIIILVSCCCKRRRDRLQIADAPVSFVLPPVPPSRPVPRDDYDGHYIDLDQALIESLNKYECADNDTSTPKQLTREQDAFFETYDGSRVPQSRAPAVPPPVSPVTSSKLKVQTDIPTKTKDVLQTKTNDDVPQHIGKTKDSPKPRPPDRNITTIPDNKTDLGEDIIERENNYEYADNDTPIPKQNIHEQDAFYESYDGSRVPQSRAPAIPPPVSPVTSPALEVVKEITRKTNDVLESKHFNDDVQKHTRKTEDSPKPHIPDNYTNTINNTFENETGMNDEYYIQPVNDDDDAEPQNELELTYEKPDINVGGKKKMDDNNAYPESELVLSYEAPLPKVPARSPRK